MIRSRRIPRQASESVMLDDYVILMTKIFCACCAADDLLTLAIVARRTIQSRK